MEMIVHDGSSQQQWHKTNTHESLIPTSSVQLVIVLWRLYLLFLPKNIREERLTTVFDTNLSLLDIRLWCGYFHIVTVGYLCHIVASYYMGCNGDWCSLYLIANNHWSSFSIKHHCWPSSIIKSTTINHRRLSIINHTNQWTMNELPTKHHQTIN